MVTFPVADRNNLQREGRKGLFGLTAEGSSPSQQRGLGGRSWREAGDSWSYPQLEERRDEFWYRSPLDDMPRGLFPW